MEYVLTQELIVDEKERVEESFREWHNISVNLDRVKEFVEVDLEKTVFFFDGEMKKKESFAKDAFIAWVDTGYVNDNNEAIFISMFNRGEYYEGHYIGTAKGLLKQQCDRNAYKASTVKKNFKPFEKRYIAAYNSRKWKKLELDDIIVENVNDDEKSLDISQEEFSQTEMQIKLQKAIGNITFEDKDIVNGVEEKTVRAQEEEFSKKLTDITEEIFHELLYPNWQSIEGLDNYLKVVGRRVSQLIEQGKTEYFVMNSIKSVIVNTGLIDMYGNDFLVLYKYHMNKAFYVPTKVIRGKAEYLEELFTKEQSCKELKPIQFFDDREDFSTDLRDYDLNTRCLRHIIDERIERFPENVREASTEKITRKIMNSLEQGLKIQERDHTYVRPIYTDGRISWLMPLRINVSFTDEPELVMVIRKSQDFYEIKTILEYDNPVKDKITALSLYRRLW